MSYDPNLVIAVQLGVAKYFDKPDVAAFEPACDVMHAENTIVTAMYRGKCNFQCRFCLWHTLTYHRLPDVTLEQVLAYIDMIDETRDSKAFLVSGMEPTTKDTLIPLIRTVKNERNKLIRLDTNGSNPAVLKALFDEGLLDYVAMDVKAPPSKYELVTQRQVDISLISRSIDLIKRRAPRYKFRTTVVRELLNQKDIFEIAKWLEEEGTSTEDVKCYEIKDVLDSQKIIGGRGQFHPLEGNRLAAIGVRLKARKISEIKVSGPREGLGWS